MRSIFRSPEMGEFVAPGVSSLADFIAPAQMDGSCGGAAVGGG